MGRKLLAVLCVAALAACDDPLVIVGDLPGFMRVTAGIPDSAGIRVDSIAVRTRLTSPAGVAADSTGILYVADLRSRIFRVTSNGRLERILNHDPCFEKTCIGRPQALAVMPGGSALLIADDMSDKIWRFNLVSREVFAIAGTGVNGVAADGTTAIAAPLASPTAVLVLPDGRVAFAERNAHKIRVINTNGQLGTLAGTGTAGSAADGASAASSPLNLPTGLALSGNTLYVSETGTHTVRAIDLATGIITRIAGSGTAGYSGDLGPALEATFDYPAALAASGSHVYVSDQNNDRVRVINLQTKIVTTFAGTGARLYNGNGLPAGQSNIFRPAGLAASRFGFLYIADSGHHIVWRTPIRANVQ
jgi:DNA-binding beta-propeller fold protein YncE